MLKQRFEDIYLKQAHDLKVADATNSIIQSTIESNVASIVTHLIFTCKTLQEIIATDEGEISTDFKQLLLDKFFPLIHSIIIQLKKFVLNEHNNIIIFNGNIYHSSILYHNPTISKSFFIHTLKLTELDVALANAGEAVDYFDNEEIAKELVTEYIPKLIRKDLYLKLDLEYIDIIESIIKDHFHELLDSTLSHLSFFNSYQDGLKENFQLMLDRINSKKNIDKVVYINNNYEAICPDILKLNELIETELFQTIKTFTDVNIFITIALKMVALISSKSIYARKYVVRF